MELLGKKPESLDCSPTLLLVFRDSERAHLEPFHTVLQEGEVGVKAGSSVSMDCWSSVTAVLVGWGGSACRASRATTVENGEGRWLISQKEKSLEPVCQWTFIGFNLHRNTGKALQSLSGSNDQTLDNIHTTMRLIKISGQIA